MAGIMKANISKVLERGEKLEALDDKAGGDVVAVCMKAMGPRFHSLVFIHGVKKSWGTQPEIVARPANGCCELICTLVRVNG